MPVFHVEEKMTLRTWDDILNRAGYESPVAAKKHSALGSKYPVHAIRTVDG